MSRPRYNVVTPTALGTFIVNRKDIGIGEHIARTGTCEPEELEVLRALVSSLQRDDAFVLDIGANIGLRAVAFAEMVGARGRVHAFEAQRIVFNMLAGNVALNSLENVWCHHVAVGARAGKIPIPQFDYTRHASFGSVEFGPRQVEAIGQERGDDPSRMEMVTLVALDDLAFPRVDLIKIDVEGMELDVLEGGQKTIARDQPVLYVEALKCDKQSLAQWLFAAGYRVFPSGYNWVGLPKRSQIVASGDGELRPEQFA